MEDRDWTTRYVKQWLAWYADLIGKPKIRGLEIGSATGRTSLWLCDHVLTGAGSELHCIDPWRKRPDDEKVFDSRVQGLQVTKHRAHSIVALPQMLIDGLRFHFIYVDGAHHAEAVLFDLAISWCLLVRGGVLVADDYQHTSRNYRLPPKVAIDGWLAATMDSVAGYEVSSGGQIAVWKQ